MIGRYLLVYLIMVINLVNANDTYADAQHATSQKEVTCISPTLSHTGTEYWQQVVLSLTNRCSISIDLNYLRIEFQDNQAIPAVWYAHPIDTPTQRSLSPLMWQHTLQVIADVTDPAIIDKILLISASPALRQYRRKGAFRSTHQPQRIDAAQAFSPSIS